MKKIIYILSFLTVFGWSSVVQAEGMNFTVKSNIPTEQKDQSISYYDVKADQKIGEITATVSNKTDKPIKVAVRVDNASSNPTGIVDYVSSPNKPIKEVPFKFKEVVTPEKDVIELAAQETKVARFKMNYPKDDFKGIVAGGLFFQEVQEKKEAAKATGVQNTFSRSIAVLLRGEKETDYHLNLTEAKPDLYTYKPAVIAKLTNTSGKFINHTTIKSKIMKKGQKEALYTKEDKEFQLASYADLNYPIVLEGDELKPGKYTLAMNVKADDEEWSFEKDFEITKKEAKEKNEKAIIEKAPFPWIWVIVGVMAVIILALLFLLMRVKKSNKN